MSPPTLNLMMHGVHLPLDEHEYYQEHPLIHCTQKYTSNLVAVHRMLTSVRPKTPFDSADDTK